MDIDSIAAIATATAPGGVGIVRVSGPDAIAIAARVAGSSVAGQASHRLRRAVFRHPETNEILDDGLVAVFRAPRSLTGEDVVELQGHGGSVTLGRVLSAALAAGARAARPGEFSERAFVNGRMDLAQAEAVADLVAARTVAAQRAARRQVEGALSTRVNAIGDTLREALARIEASIDFPEEVGETDPVRLDALLADAETQITRLLSTAHYGRRLTEGITVVLAGRPNVGKSSLLNALVGHERSIVTDIPGTTRDVVEAGLTLGGIPVRALDTAGLRDETDDPVERIGVARTRTALADADIVVAVIDATAPDTAGLENAAHVVVANKSDLIARPTIPDAIAVSAKTGLGLDALSDAIVRAASGSGPLSDASVLVTSARHEAALRAASDHTAAARATLANGLPIELVAVDLHGALASLGQITGETAREEIIAGIFARFCIGK